MRDLEHAQMMIELAAKDLKAVAAMGDTASFDIEIIGFHAQQAVEKATKAWLSYTGTEYPKTHDITLLLNLLRQNGESIPERFESLIDLNDFAVQFRYEILEPTGISIDRRLMVERVSEFVHFVQNKVTGSTDE